MSRSNFQRTATWLQACGKGQTVPNLSVQIGCDLEEYAEFLDCIELDSEWDQGVLNDLKKDLARVGELLKKAVILARIPAERRVDALDARCDIEVTGNGICYLADFDKDAADDAVLSSNEAKLVDGKPVILAGGKIGKPAGWTPPNLAGFV